VAVWVGGIVSAHTAPQFLQVREAAKSQHDEQNNAIEQGFMSVHARIDEIDERLDAGAKHLAHHDVDIAVLNERNPSTRSRQGDTS